MIINKKQKILCDVKSCFFNKDTELCDLGTIKVSNCKEKSTKEATMCDSYKSKKDVS